ncbi:hypothetical protein O181_013777 [Austropuccinia psidii MF-1]|uniref:Uncharacterized protein n=1 Tax=Austropuccinia psidii MF-1 TaxID=1389203 RepID=A0A9Q3C0D0_9BASI|nr:hypothetical protein [Austropuccinia psidii MF-1]
MYPVHLRDFGISGTSQMKEKDYLDPEDQGLYSMINGKKLREIMLKLPLAFQFNRDLKPEDWKDKDQVLQLHQLLKDLFQWSMEHKRFNLVSSHWEELGESFQKLCLREMSFK